jgi:hypothetical protein
VGAERVESQKERGAIARRVSRGGGVDGAEEGRTEARCRGEGGDGDNEGDGWRRRLKRGRRRRGVPALPVSESKDQRDVIGCRSAWNSPCKYTITVCLAFCPSGPRLSDSLGEQSFARHSSSIPFKTTGRLSHRLEASLVIWTSFQSIPLNSPSSGAVLARLSLREPGGTEGR